MNAPHECTDPEPSTPEPSDDEWADGGFGVLMGEWLDADLDLSCDTENPESCESCT